MPDEGYGDGLPSCHVHRVILGQYVNVNNNHDPTVDEGLYRGLTDVVLSLDRSDVTAVSQLYIRGD